MTNSHRITPLFTSSDVECLTIRQDSQIYTNNQGALSLGGASALGISRNKLTGAGNAQLGISWRLAERKKRLPSPDILLLLDPARGEQRFS